MDQTTPEWMKDELVKDIPESKLQLLEELYTAGQGKTKDNLMRTLLPILARAKQEKISFTQEEMAMAIAAIRKYSTPEENNKINSLMNQTKKRPE